MGFLKEGMDRSTVNVNTHRKYSICIKFVRSTINYRPSGSNKNRIRKDRRTAIPFGSSASLSPLNQFRPLSTPSSAIVNIHTIRSGTRVASRGRSVLCRQREDEVSFGI